MGAHPASCAVGTGSFPGLDVDRQSASSAEVKEKLELYLYVPTRPVLGRTLLSVGVYVLIRSLHEPVATRVTHKLPASITRNVSREFLI